MRPTWTGCAAAASGALVKADGGSWRDAFKAAAITWATTQVFNRVGDYTKGWNTFARGIAHGITGGTINTLQGGSFSSGFWGASVSLWTRSEKLYPGDRYGGAFTRGLVGGIVTRATGGDFETGFVTAGLAYIFNDCGAGHGGCKPRAQKHPVYSVADGKVERASWQNDKHTGLGFRVTISDKEGYYQYGHIDPDSLEVSKGDSVRAGQLIGSYADPTNGSSTGPHVHIERRLWTNPQVTVDPGTATPFGFGGRITSRWGSVDSAHQTPHQGTDWIFP